MFIAFDEDLMIRRHIDRYLRDEGVEVSIAMHFDNIQMIKEAVALGSGISILPDRTMLAEIEQGRLVSIPLAAPPLFRPLGIVHRKRKRFEPGGTSLSGFTRGRRNGVASGALYRRIPRIECGALTSFYEYNVEEFTLGSMLNAPSLISTGLDRRRISA